MTLELRSLRHAVTLARLLNYRRAAEELGVTSENIDEALKSKAALETELRSAIPMGDIVPYFQPVVYLETGALAGF